MKIIHQDEKGILNPENTRRCFDLGVNYEKGQGVEQDNVKAVELFAKAYDGENSSICYNLGAM